MLFQVEANAQNNNCKKEIFGYYTDNYAGKNSPSREGTFSTRYLKDTCSNQKIVTAEFAFSGQSDNEQTKTTMTFTNGPVPNANQALTFELGLDSANTQRLIAYPYKNRQNILFDSANDPNGYLKKLVVNVDKTKNTRQFNFTLDVAPFWSGQIYGANISSNQFFGGSTYPGIGYWGRDVTNAQLVNGNYVSTSFFNVGPKVTFDGKDLQAMPLPLPISCPGDRPELVFDFNDLTAGEIVSGQYEDFFTVRGQKVNGTPLRVIAFDTANPPSNYTDVGTPTTPVGPGKSQVGGLPGFDNHEAKKIALSLSDKVDSDGDGFIDQINTVGGLLIFDFPGDGIPITRISAIDAGDDIPSSYQTQQKTIQMFLRNIPNFGGNSYQVLYMEHPENVSVAGTYSTRLVIQVNDQGGYGHSAFDDLAVCPECLPEDRDECGVCNGPGEDECGFCEEDPEFGLGQDECGLCPLEQGYEIGLDECGFCYGEDGFGEGEDDCGYCFGDEGYLTGQDECGFCFNDPFYDEGIDGCGYCADEDEYETGPDECDLCSGEEGFGLGMDSCKLCPGHPSYGDDSYCHPTPTPTIKPTPTPTPNCPPPGMLICTGYGNHQHCECVRPTPTPTLKPTPTPTRKPTPTPTLKPTPTPTPNCPPPGMLICAADYGNGQHCECVQPTPTPTIEPTPTPTRKPTPTPTEEPTPTPTVEPTPTPTPICVPPQVMVCPEDNGGILLGVPCMCMDPTPTPTLEPTPTPTLEPTPTPTVEPTPTPTVEPTPTPCVPDECGRECSDVDYGKPCDPCPGGEIDQCGICNGDGSSCCETNDQYAKLVFRDGKTHVMRNQGMSYSRWIKRVQKNHGRLSRKQMKRVAELTASVNEKQIATWALVWTIRQQNTQCNEQAQGCTTASNVGVLADTEASSESLLSDINELYKLYRKAAPNRKKKRAGRPLGIATDAHKDSTEVGLTIPKTDDLC